MALRLSQAAATSSVTPAAHPHPLPLRTARLRACFPKILLKISQELHGALILSHLADMTISGPLPLSSNPQKTTYCCSQSPREYDTARMTFGPRGAVVGLPNALPPCSQKSSRDRSNTCSRLRPTRFCRACTRRQQQASKHARLCVATLPTDAIACLRDDQC